MPPPLTYQQTAAVIARLAELGSRVILVGGQAVSFWAHRYAPRDPVLAAAGPFTSKDIDFVASREVVVACAKRLQGTARVATLDDAGTPNTGIVLFVDDEGHTRQIDFLGSVAGVSDRDLARTSIGVTATDDHGAPIASFQVMHPLLCLESRAYNVAYLPSYATPHACSQLRAAIRCSRAFARESFDGVRIRLDYNEAIFGLAAYRAGPVVFVRHGIDVLDAALLDDADLPDAFFARRLPNVRQRIERARAAAARREPRT